MNYYPFHLGDYAAHTGHLEPLEDLAYRRMLDLYYLREVPLPVDPSEVARLIRMRGHVEEVSAVLREFFQPGDDGWRHARCDEEIARMQDKQMKARTSAAASVNARRSKAARTLNDGEANAQRTQSERSTDVELPTPTPTPIGIGARSPRGSRLPHDELPKDWREWALSERPDLDPDSVFARFADYWRGAPGAKGRKSDWLATWRNWVRDQRSTPRVVASNAEKPWAGAI